MTAEIHTPTKREGTRTMTPLENNAVQTHTIYLDNESGEPTDYPCAYIAPADPKIAEAILAMPQDGTGRSEWLWCRLQNGTLILGCFPQDGGYWASEADPNRP